MVKITKENRFWVVLGIISLFLIIHGMSDTGDPDKKTAEAAQDEVAAGVIGAGASGIMLYKKSMAGTTAAVVAGASWAGPIGWVLAGVAAIFFLPTVIGRIGDIFRPTPTIPGWVWPVGFLVLLLLVMKKK